MDKGTKNKIGIMMRCLLGLFVMAAFVPNFFNFNIAYKNGLKDVSVTDAYIDEKLSETQFSLPVIYIRSYDYDTLHAVGHIPISNSDVEPDKIPTKCDIYVLDNGINRITDRPVHVYKDAIITLRGKSSSFYQTKKPYKIEFADALGRPVNLPFLDMPMESDFVLAAPEIDRSLIRNWLGYELQRQVLDWAPQTQFVEVIVDRRGTELEYTDYKGVYMLTENVKNGANRINVGNFIMAANPENQFENGGGYIYKMDWYNPRLDDAIRLPANSVGNEYSLVSLKRETAKQEQIDTVFNEIQTYDEALYNGTDEELEQYFDLQQIARCMLICEYMKNHEAISSSTFFYRMVGGKIKIFQWDFDLGTGNARYERNIPSSGWWVLDYWPYPQEFLQHENFRQIMLEEWKWLREGVLSDENITNLLKKVEQQLDGAWQRNDEVYIRNFTETPPFFNNLNNLQNSRQEREAIKTYLAERGKWMDENLCDLMNSYREEELE